MADGDLAVDFAVFSYRNEAAVSFRYRLVGLEDIGFRPETTQFAIPSCLPVNTGSKWCRRILVCTASRLLQR